MNLTIRTALDSDARRITDIINPIIRSGRYILLDSPFSVSDQAFLIQYFPVNGVFLVAEEKDTKEIVGYQTVEPFANYSRALDHVGIVNTYVAKQYHRQGIATALFSTMLDIARSRGFEKLVAQVRADNDAALQTYTKQGFEVSGRAKKQAKMGENYIDEITMERFL
ncbi:GNAT family N-acetyltransferase [Grimontia hollisae]|uniref:GNAT family N-acetyltransferase n=1 Tax=Grimontia hollisae TaxID=673 RepID=UPI001303E437|nr:GNAT family N-acetyltransferase [Grimontia hollisae]